MYRPKHQNKIKLKWYKICINHISKTVIQINTKSAVLSLYGYHYVIFCHIYGDTTRKTHFWKVLCENVPFQPVICKIKVKAFNVSQPSFASTQQLTLNVKNNIFLIEKQKHLLSDISHYSNSNSEWLGVLTVANDSTTFVYSLDLFIRTVHSTDFNSF